jgi:hypothetical protein
MCNDLFTCCAGLGAYVALSACMSQSAVGAGLCMWTGRGRITTRIFILALEPSGMMGDLQRLLYCYGSCSRTARDLAFILP